jgi:PPOX class probable F420-dependent enzyme
MRQPDIPEAVVPLLTQNHLAVVATVRPDSEPSTAHVWVDWDGQRLYFSSRAGSVKGRNIRANPAVSVHVVDGATNTWIQVRGVVDVQPDDGLVFIDRLSHRYRGIDYPLREFEREVFTVEVRHVRSSAG